VPSLDRREPSPLKEPLRSNSSWREEVERCQVTAKPAMQAQPSTRSGSAPRKRCSALEGGFAVVTRRLVEAAGRTALATEAGVTVADSAAAAWPPAAAAACGAGNTAAAGFGIQEP